MKNNFEQKWVERAKRGELAAIAEIYRRYWRVAAMSLWVYSAVWLWYLQQKRLWNRLLSHLGNLCAEHYCDSRVKVLKRCKKSLKSHQKVCNFCQFLQKRRQFLRKSRSFLLKTRSFLQIFYIFFNPNPHLPPNQFCIFVKSWF